jgi:Gpi18-like mannosyltransferase
LFPEAARAVSWLPSVSAALAVVLVANVCALGAGFLLYELIVRERRGIALARRSVWILYLAPSAFVLVMGYAESLLLVAALVSLIALRSRSWWVAAAAGVVAGLTRPVGLLLIVPALFETYRAGADHWPPVRRCRPVVAPRAPCIWRGPSTAARLPHIRSASAK